jgi:GNAT superfamily N-acetyltransferase
MEIRLLDADEARARIPELALILYDCVVKGASVGFMNPFSMAEAIGFYAECAENAANGEAFLFAAFVNGRAVGTVQLIPSRKPNQPHRGDIIKMLVHSTHRNQGFGVALLKAAEDEARRRGLILLTLDTAGVDGERFYERAGYSRAGVIPDFALWPDGGYCDTVIYYKKI